MSNNWKYATLGQRERLNLIRNGESEVYNYEKNKNDSLKKIQSALGLSTKDVDDWDATIDNAYSSSKEKTARSALPKFGSSRLSELNKELSASIKELKKQKNESIEAANTEAESALKYLEEWLASNGYSMDGKLATDAIKELNSARDNALKSITEDYDEQLKNIRGYFLSKAR